MLKIKEILYGTIMKEPDEYENRYIFKGKLNKLLNNGFVLKKENEVIEEIKTTIGKDDEVYYKKSGCGYFIVFKNDNENITFMSGVPIWWIGDEDLTNYYEDVDNLIKSDLVEEVSNE
jgi:hypothetical protein